MFKILKKDQQSNARRGVLETPHGEVHTPAFVAVGTNAKIRTLEPADLEKTNTQLIIVNTYHMWKELGEERLKTFSGLHSHMSWPKTLMTDSGGFQVFSLGYGRVTGTGKIAQTPENSLLSEQPEKNLTKITEDGVYFFDPAPLVNREGSHETQLTKGAGFDGEEHFLDAEKSMKIQEQLGADIIFAFDEPSSPLHDYNYSKVAMDRTHRWAVRSLKARTSNQLLFGIIQGGSFEDLRKESARVISGMPFDGFGVGGSFGNSFGSRSANTFQEISWVCPLLPEEKPRHLLGIGRIEDIFIGVSQGIDSFDCVIPTREARHGSIWTATGRIDMKKGIFADDTAVLDENCSCFVCSTLKISKGALHHLFKAKNFDAGRFATIHNLAFSNGLLAEIRTALENNTFRELQLKYLQK